MSNIIVIGIGDIIDGKKEYLFFKPYGGYVLRSDANRGTPMQLIHGDWVGYIDFDKFVLHTSFAEYPPILRYAEVTQQDLHYSNETSNLADFDELLVEWVVNPAIIEQAPTDVVPLSKFELLAEQIIADLKSSYPDIVQYKTNKGKYMLLLPKQYLLDIDAVGILDIDINIEVNWISTHEIKISQSIVNLVLSANAPEPMHSIFVSNAIAILKEFCNGC